MSRKPADQHSSSKGGKPGKQVSSDTEKQSPAAARAEKIRTGAQRETAEAFVVAFILALLFRAFIAEAFVIPTGSMAPTLMGAHKEISCDRCGYWFRIGASAEQRELQMQHTVVGGVCPNCRYKNPHDLKNNSEDETFSGDRILVSKSSYALHEPERWDTIVFKFPGNPKQNYIKRLVGLPNETITIRHGDIFARPTGSREEEQIVRKPASTLLAMRHLVYDSDFQSLDLIASGYPSRMQPWKPGDVSVPEDSWQVKRTQDGLTASVSGDSANDNLSPPTNWLRYYHRWANDQQWSQAKEGGSLANIDPYSTRAITDFYSYNSYVLVESGDVYDVKPTQANRTNLNRLLGSGFSRGEFKRTYQSGESLDQFSQILTGAVDTTMDGMHWVGDLIVETDIETEENAQELILELVEAGVKYWCQFDLATGTAILSIDKEGQTIPFATDQIENGVLQPTATTEVTAGSRHAIRFSNCDNQLLLWVDDTLVTFDSPTTFDGRLVRSIDQNIPRYDGNGNPLDGSPVGIAAVGGATVHHVRIDRDKYYIATKDSSGGIVLDYDRAKLSEATGRNVRWGALQQGFTIPSEWANLATWESRREVSFEMGPDQFFPMGDNSPESLDARCWAGTTKIGQPRSVDPDSYLYSDAYYVPRDLLVGKALMVFWPHPWNTPVPFTPNFNRMKLIR